MLEALFQRLHQDATRHGHRRLLVVCGSQSWCYRQASALENNQGMLWIGNDYSGPAESIPIRQVQRFLGRSVDHIIYDAWSGFNPDSFGQASGLIKAGGILTLLCPEFSEWGAYDDPEYQSLTPYPLPVANAGRRFINRICHYLEDDPYTVLLSEQQALAGVEIELPEQSESVTHRPESPVFPHKTYDQQQCVELILKQFRRNRRPVVITADRGRGKSVALGIAAAQLSGLDFKSIFITAPEYSCVEEAFRIAQQLLPDYDYAPGKLEKAEHAIHFVEPASLAKVPSEGAVLLVDEAAALSVSILKLCLERFSRVAFATTIHGYEGNGQGFAIRFKQVLHELTPNWKSIHLKQPIRWRENDPLEGLVFDLLLLNADAAEFDHALVGPIESKLQFEKIDRDLLTEDYETLNQLFGLLVLAHYRTSPGDLRVLLDTPGLHIWIIRIDGKVAAAALVAEEGPLPEDLVDAIWSGKRRPRGHLLPQTLVAQEGVKSAAPLKAGRVIRIAVHPELQRAGLGAKLLQHIECFAREQHWDYLGSSYAVNDQLARFWHQSAWTTLRLGSSKDSVSGSYAALVMRPLSEPAIQLSKVLAERFAQQLDYRLGDDLNDLNIDVVCYLLAHTVTSSDLSIHERGDLIAFVRYNRSYESCAQSINKFLRGFLRRTHAEQLSHLLQNEEVTLLLKKSLQRRQWCDLGEQGLGRKGLVRQMRTALALLIELDDH